MTEKEVYLKPITGKELKKHGKVILAWKEDDPENIEECDIKEPLGIIDGLHLLSRYPDHIITVEPVIEVNDQHIAVARLKLRRCNKMPGDTWE